MTKPIIVGITGASGVIYGISLLKALRDLEINTHLVLSEGGIRNIDIETDHTIQEVLDMATTVHDINNIGANIASGSFLTAGMIIAPCTMKTLSAVANSFDYNLLIRAADVTLKEKRRLVLMVRETPLHKGHLKLMLRAADIGAMILPPVPAFYHRPKTIADIINQSIGKALDFLSVEHRLFDRWSGV